MVHTHEGRYKRRLSSMLSVAFAIDFVCGSLDVDSCLSTDDNGGGAGLLQAARAPPIAQETALLNADDLKSTSQHGLGSGVARRVLPGELHVLGIQLMKSEAALDGLVASTFGTSFDFPWTQGSSCTMRTVVGDASPAFDPKEDYYGLIHLGDPAAERLNMLDVGGNIGLVTIGAFKKNPEKMRIVVVEPSPSTYFLLRWNLWLNQIQVFPTISDFKAFPDEPGVLALNNGVGSVDGQTFGLCYTPPLTQNAVICECKAEDAARIPQIGVQQCQQIKSYSLPSLFALFNNQTISMLKMDCEGCEKALLPALSQVSFNQIARFSGELHSVGNDLEDIVCKFEQGRWFIHVCNTGGRYDVIWLRDRCLQGAARTTCTNP